MGMISFHPEHNIAAIAARDITERVAAAYVLCAVLLAATMLGFRLSIECLPLLDFGSSVRIRPAQGKAREVVH